MKHADPGKFEVLPILIHVEGATIMERAQGIAAALRIFEAAGATPVEAANAKFKDEGPALGGPNLTERETALLGLWEQADRAAAAACCAGWENAPTSADLMLPEARRRVEMMIADFVKIELGNSRH